MPDDNKTTDTNPTPPIPPMEPSISPPFPPPTPPTDQGQPTDTPPPATDSTIPPPPPIIEEQLVGTATPPAQDADIPPVVTIGEKPKGKVGKKVIATILGILFLVGGISTGVILVQRQQDIREKAALAEPCNVCVNNVCKKVASPPNCSSSLNECSNVGGPCGGTPPPSPSCAADGKCVRYGGADSYCCSGKSYYDAICETGTKQRCGTLSPTPTPTRTPTPTPTGAGISARCLNIQAFDTDWNSLTNEQLAALKLGDKVRFTVAGTTTSGSIDRARFIINGTQRPAVTQKRPGTNRNEFYDEYTIPEGTTSFKINAQLHHTDSSIGWF